WYSSSRPEIVPMAPKWSRTVLSKLHPLLISWVCQIYSCQSRPTHCSLPPLRRPLYHRQRPDRPIEAEDHRLVDVFRRRYPLFQHFLRLAHRRELYAVRDEPVAARRVLHAHRRFAHSLAERRQSRDLLICRLRGVYQLDELHHRLRAEPVHADEALAKS